MTATNQPNEEEREAAAKRLPLEWEVEIAQFRAEYTAMFGADQYLDHHPELRRLHRMQEVSQILADEREWEVILKGMARVKAAMDSNPKPLQA